MRYIFTATWSVLISFAVAYVLGAMAGESFSVQNSLILAAFFFVFTVLMGDVIMKPEKEHK